MIREDRTDVIDKARAALELVTEDGEWPSPACEEGPQALRAAAMQGAVQLLAEAVESLAGEFARLREDVERRQV